MTAFVKLVCYVMSTLRCCHTVQFDSGNNLQQSDHTVLATILLSGSMNIKNEDFVIIIIIIIIMINCLSLTICLFHLICLFVPSGGSRHSARGGHIFGGSRLGVQFNMFPSISYAVFCLK